MKKVLGISVVAILVLSLAIITIAQGNKYNIGVFFWHQSPLDHMAFEGIKDGFNIMDVGCEFDVQKAFGEEEKASKIIQGWAEQKPDLIYAMGTGATKRLMKVIRDTPIVFTAVTNPVQSGITPNWKTSGRNIAGNSNWIATKEILRDFKKVIPELKTLGVMYDPDNSVSSMEVREGNKVADTLGAVNQRIGHRVVPGNNRVAAHQGIDDWCGLVTAAVKLNSIIVVGVDLVEVFHGVMEQGAVIGGADNSITGDVFDGITLDLNLITANHDTVINISERITSDLDPFPNNGNAVADAAVPLFR